MKRITNLLMMIHILAMVLLSNYLNAQQPCASQLTQEHVDFINTQQERISINTEFFEQGIITVPLTVHLIRDAQGMGGLSEDSLLTSINQLNTAFQQAGFEFSLCSTNYIDNNTYYNNLLKSVRADSDEFTMAVPNLIAGSINIFYAPNSLNWSSYPFDKIKYGKDWIVINNANSTDGSTLAHEMGHYFSLYHTHEYFLGSELANGSNCETAGDEICDTPAEPFTNSMGKEGIDGCVDEACMYVCDDGYTPNPENIMSYAPASCKNFFSPLQISRMQLSFVNDRKYLLNNCEQINTCEATDREALIALYNATDGPNWHSNWKTPWDLSKDHKDWDGVSVNNEGCVIELNLYGRNLNGTIPDEIGNIVNLESLNLNQNPNIEGEIPSNIGSLINLSYLNLHNNNLSGEIPPEIGKLENLNHLYLSGNNFTGIIPEEIGNLNQLSILNLGYNRLTGNLPKSIGNLTSLYFFNIQDNNLSGCYEPELKNLCGNSAFNEISTSNNFDASWIDFCLNGNGICLDGVSQSDLCDLSKNKEALIAIYNATDGSNWHNTWDLNSDYKNWYGVNVNSQGCVVKLDLNSNNLTGSIPKEIGNLLNLISLNISSNNFSGSIPAEIGMLEKLIELEIRYSNLTGSIPEEIGNLSLLERLNLKGNSLAGNIPKSLNYLTNLISLNTNDNNLSGCYEPELKGLCHKFWYPTGDVISEGNNFDAPWGDFCAFDTGICESNNANFVAGDYNKNGVVNHYDALYLGLSYGKTGVVCEATNIAGCPDWDADINGVNAKYIDGDRNGIINEADAQTIKDNYGKSSNSNNTLNAKPKEFSFRMELAEVLFGNTTKKYTYRIYIENFDNEIEDIKGIAGCINFAELLVVRPRVSFLDSNFETSIIIDNYNPSTKILDIALTSSEDLNLKANKPIAELIFITEDINNGGGDYEIKLSDFITINASGELSKGINSSYSLDELLPKLNVVEKGNANLSQNYPNPFSQQSSIPYFIPQSAKEANLKVYTLTGSLMQNTPINHTGSGNLILSSANLNPGLYIYTLEIDGVESSSKKMIIQK